MIELTVTQEGIVLPVRAQPGARRNAIVGQQADALKIAVTAPPDRGRANEAIVEVLSESLGISKSQIQLHSGPTSRQKKFLIRNKSLEEVQQWLSACREGSQS